VVKQAQPSSYYSVFVTHIVILGWRPRLAASRLRGPGGMYPLGYIVTLKRKKAYARVEPAAYLFDDALIAEYLSLAAEDPDPDVFLAALSEVVRARGVAQTAADSGLCRESLYKALSAGAHPRFETINSVLHALGVKIAVVVERRR